MQDVFTDLLAIDAVSGVLLFSNQGEVLCQAWEHTPKLSTDSAKQLREMIVSLDTMQEADLVFTQGRLYLRHTDAGYLCVIAAPSAPSAMIRLNCDMLLPKLRELSSRSGLRGFFRRSA